MPQAIAESKSQRWVDVLRASGEGDLGAAMLRLARLAAAAHMQALADEHAREESLTQEAAGVHGRTPSPVAERRATALGTARTEAGR